MQVGNGVEGDLEFDSDELELLQLKTAQLDIERIRIHSDLSTKDSKISDLTVS